jgi:hypothetical protein
MSDHEPPARVLLCLEPGCYGEFYLPLDLADAMVCPNDRGHRVAVYSGPCLHHPQDDHAQEAV